MSSYGFLEEDKYFTAVLEDKNRIGFLVYYLEATWGTQRIGGCCDFRPNRRTKK